MSKQFATKLEDAENHVFIFNCSYWWVGHLPTHPTPLLLSSQSATCTWAQQSMQSNPALQFIPIWEIGSSFFIGNAACLHHPLNAWQQWDCKQELNGSQLVFLPKTLILPFFITIKASNWTPQPCKLKHHLNPWHRFRTGRSLSCWAPLTVSPTSENKTEFWLATSGHIVPVTVAGFGLPALCRREKCVLKLPLVRGNKHTSGVLQSLLYTRWPG